MYPGKYVESSALNINTDFVDIIGLGSIKKHRGCECAVYVASGISVNANDVKLVGLETSSFYITTNRSNIFLENCKANLDESFGSAGTVVCGTYINCESNADSCFGGFFSYISGVFINCKGQNSSFGYDNNTTILSNTKFINCEAGNESFGSNGSISYGYFENCIAKDLSFGGLGSIASGIYDRCVGGSGSFGGDGGIPAGKFYYCRLTSGTFSPPVGGKYIYCIDGNNNGYNA